MGFFVFKPITQWIKGTPGTLQPFQTVLQSTVYQANTRFYNFPLSITATLLFLTHLSNISFLPWFVFVQFHILAILQLGIYLFKAYIDNTTNKKKQWVNIIWANLKR